MLSFNCSLGSTGPSMGTRRGGGNGGGTSSWSMPRIIIGAEAAEGERLLEKETVRLGRPNGLGRVSPCPVDTGGRGPGLVLASLPPYPPREGAWMGMAAMTSSWPGVARRGKYTASTRRTAESELTSKATGAALAAAAAYEGLAEPRPTEAGKRKAKIKTSLQPWWMARTEWKLAENTQLFRRPGKPVLPRSLNLGLVAGTPLKIQHIK
ncbi:hypothetical protein VTG60DRAFT_1083 [Thermothelomyces hinnuleus]